MKATDVNDLLIEGPQSFPGQSLSGMGPATPSGSQQIDVTDNDTATVSIVGGTTTVVEGGATGTVTVTLDLTANGAAGGTLASNVTATLPGNADYTATTVTFVAGVAADGATADITVTAVNDLLIEGPQSFPGQALSATGPATPSGSEQIDVTDNDTATVSIVGGTTTVAEGGATGTVTVTLDLTANGAAGGTLASNVTATLPGDRKSVV